MTADALPAVPVHQLGNFAALWIPKLWDEIPEASDNDDKEIMNSYFWWKKDLSDPKKWKASPPGAQSTMWKMTVDQQNKIETALSIWETKQRVHFCVVM